MSSRGGGDRRDDDLSANDGGARSNGAAPTGEELAPHLGDDRDLWDGPERPRAIKLLQGYIWHPREEEVDLEAHLPAELQEGVHVLVDAMPAAPFTFFDDGTLSATQQVYQLTVVAIVKPGEDPGKLLPRVAELLQAMLDETPKDVGWQLMDDLREID